MSNCPICQAELADDFGLIDCPGCGAVLFMELDGSVKMKGQDLLEEEKPTSEPSRSTPAFDDPGPEQEFDFGSDVGDVSLDGPEDFATNFEFSAPPAPPEPPSEESSEYFDDEPPAIPDDSGSESESVGENEFEAKDSADEAQEQAAADYFNFDDEPLAVAEPVAAASSGEDMSQLANSMDSGAEATGLRYDLIIEGIDTADLRRDTRDALYDSKFGWDADQLIKTVQSGKLVIKSVSAVKAQIVIQRLKILPLELSWEQYADS